MFLFEYVLILLTAIFLSNFIHRFIPIISVPIIQIILGALITLIPLHFQFELDPNLFFVLFIAPLIFNISMLADKKTLWNQRKPILNMGIFLAIATVVIVGYFVHWLIPAIPLVVAFVLTGALAPTDDVAVVSVGKRVNIPPKIMRILEGEGIINDASGIIAFQFALAAILTGSFSLMQATGRFFVVGLGGIVVGLLFTWLKYEFLKWIRSLGMENVILHILIGILTPFAIYLISEAFEVSGILAVFAAGIAHSFQREKFNPAAVNLNIASDSIWSVLSFTLEGMVFLILGTQLPKILNTVTQNSYSMSMGTIMLYVLVIVFLILLIRFIWSVITISTKLYADAEYSVSRWRAGIIFSLSGARGAVTLASILSIPLLLPNGKDFPQRDLMILLSSGVILVSLIITNFILPLFITKKTVEIDSVAEDNACIEILNNVVTELNTQITPENRNTMAVVVSNYYKRIVELQRKRHYRPNRKAEQRLKVMVYNWEKEHTIDLLKQGKIDETMASKYTEMLEMHYRKFSKNILHPLHIIQRNIAWFIRHNRQNKNKEELFELRKRFVALVETNKRFVLGKLKDREKIDNNPIVGEMITSYEFALSLHQKRGAGRYDENNENIFEIAARGFQLERHNIQTMVEAGRISRDTAKEMRHNISLLEVQLQQDDF